MPNELLQENVLLKKEIRVLHEAAELTADLVIQQFEQTELEKHRYREVAANLEGFKRTLDQVGDCVFMFDPQTFIFTYVNDVAIDHTGFSQAELFTMSFADFGPSLTFDKLQETFTYLAEHPEESLLLQTTFKRKNGVIVPVEIFVQYIAPPNSRGRFFSFVRNISKRLLEEKEKEQMQTKMLHTQKLESVGELAAGIAHEINTPIQFVATNLSFLEESFADLNDLLTKCQGLLDIIDENETTADHIRTIRKCIEDIDLEYLRTEVPQAIHQAADGVERVSKLVLAMKDFSHPGGKEKERGDINKIIQTTIQISRNEWKYIADVELDLAESLPLIPCHPSDIGQVLLNIVLNAAHSIKDRLEKFPQSPRGLIVIKTARAEDNVTIAISDNGCGIPESIHSKIFDPFFTTKEVGKGTGQGLAIARNIITNKHHGDIAMHSEEGVGATFTIHLPWD